ncbi:MAG: histidine phosphatase family protein [Armatimonadetes bacterium]|nr:histidine phosphatase family protein [Armatimonadota bacterium]
MQVLLIRHGDPDYTNDTLTEKGHTEARALAESLRHVPLHALYVSPFGRAQRTAKYTARVKQMQPTTLEWIGELDGHFGGGRWCWNVSGSEHLLRDDLPTVANWHEDVPYGELMRPQYERLASNFDSLLEEYGYTREGLRYRVDQSNDLTIALFCHAGLILTLLGHLLNWPVPLVYSHLSYDPTGVTRLLWEEVDGYAVPRAKTINDLSHLTNGRISEWANGRMGEWANRRMGEWANERMGEWANGRMGE